MRVVQFRRNRVVKFSLLGLVSRSLQFLNVFEHEGNNVQVCLIILALLVRHYGDSDALPLPAGFGYCQSLSSDS